MATDISAITASAVQDQDSGNKHSFRGLFSEARPFTATLTDTTQAADTAATCDVTVLGAALGDLVLVASSADLTDGILAAQVSAADTVTITCWNPEGTDAITPFAGGVNVNGVVLKLDAGKLAGLQ